MDDKFDEIIDEGELDSSYIDSNNQSTNSPNIYRKIQNTVGNTVEKTGKGIDNVGKTVKTTGQSIETIGKGVETAGKATESLGKASQIAGKGTQATGKSAKALGKATQTAGEGLSAAGDSAITAGEAASATGAGAVAGVPLVVAGAIGKALGTGADVAGKGIDAAGTGLETAGKGMESAGKGMETSGKNIQTSGKNMQNTGKDIKKSGENISESGKKIRNYGKSIKKEESSNSVLPDEIKKVLNTSNKTTQIIDNVKKVAETLSNPIKRAVLFSIVGLLLLIILVAYVLEPITDAMDKIKTGADYVEKLNNFMHGLGFENSKDAFYDELEFLELHYDGELNEPLLMATLFYDDVYDGKNIIGLENSISSQDDVNLFATTLMALIDYAGKEALTETDANGVVYSANKIFRLKKLANHMVDKTGDNLETVSFDDYVSINGSILSSDGNALLKSFVSVLCCQILLSLDISTYVSQKVIEKMLPDYYTFLGTMLENGYITSHDGMDAILNFGVNSAYYIKDLINVFSDIQGVGITLSVNGTNVGRLSFGESDNNNSGILDTVSQIINSLDDFSLSNLDVDIDIDITYSKYDVSEEEYFNYLKNDYIPNMPEFKSIVYDKNGNLKDKKVDEIIEDIKLLANTWEEIYGDGGSAFNNNVCIGNIHPTLIDQLHLPIDLEEGTEVNFSTTTAFGVSKNGSMHNGVDLNEESTGTTVGAPVYAIYNGTVISSTASGDYTDSIVNGGWLKISHTLSYTNDKGENVDTTIYSVYGGLDPMSVPTTGTTVSIGQQIGVVGAAVYSEDNKIPGLHFGIIDSLTNEYLNPINVFITCSAYSNSGTGICYYDSSGGLIVEIPDNIVNYNQMNYSVTCYNDYGWVLSCKNPTRISSSSLQNRVHKLWVADGARYKNGIAVLNVNGVDRYLVATTQKFGASGELINATLQNGETIPMVIADTKSYSHTGVINDKQCNIPLINDPGCYGHFNSSTNTLSVLEFEVDPNEYNNNPNGKSPGAWGQEWDTTQKVESITRYGSLLDSSINVGEICDNNYVDPSISNDPGELINANGIINQRLDLFLEKKGSSIDLYNNSVIDAIKNHGGYCTRTGSIAAAKELINYIGRYDAKLPYTCGGGWGSRITGPQANWGSHYSSPHCNTNCGSKCYIQDGLDCAGFVRWVLNTAGYNIPAMAANDFNENNLPGAVDVPLANTQVLQPGDIMYSSGHVVFVIGVNESAHKYIIAEAAGLDSGVQFSTKSFTASDYTGVKMSGFYNESTNCIH